MANNGVILIGNLTKEPVLKRTSGNKPVLNFRVAVDGGGNSSEQAGFFDCAAWGDLAENLSSSLVKGLRVMVSGQLKQRTFESNGQSRTVSEVLVEDAGPSLLWATANVHRRVRVQQAS